MSSDDIRKQIADRLADFSMEQKKEVAALSDSDIVRQEIADKLKGLNLNTCAEVATVLVETTEKLLPPRNNKDIYRIGIDPGVTGGITIHNLVTDEYRLHDMPVFKTVNKKGGTRTLYDPKGLHVLLIPYAGCKLFLEDLEAVATIPAKPGSKFSRGAIANFSLGVGMGTIEAICAVLDISVVKFRPADWKRGALRGVSDKSDKDSVRQFAIQTFPQLYAELSRVKDHNRAESLLLCAYGEECEGIRGSDTLDNM